MFINWAHFMIPKVFFVLSFIFNPIFVMLIRSEKVFQFGDYRYLLYFFAIFNMTTSVADLLIPICVHSYRYATIVFTAGGPFSVRSHQSETLIAYRCAFISGTYGILNSHFIFRYMILRHNRFVSQYFLPRGLLASISLVIFHICFWGAVTDYTMDSSGESREYGRESFERAVGSLDDVNIKVVIFSEASPDVMFRSWLGTLIVTAMASYSIILYFVLGYKIMSGLNKGLITMSHKTTQMQKRLFLALSVQTAIPICVSFMPCTLVLYGCAFRIDFPNWVNWLSSIAVSTFPVFDPMAIILCLPALRNRLFLKLGIDLSKRGSNQIQTLPSS